MEGVLDVTANLRIVAADAMECARVKSALWDRRCTCVQNLRMSDSARFTKSFCVPLLRLFGHRRRLLLQIDGKFA